MVMLGRVGDTMDVPSDSGYSDEPQGAPAGGGPSDDDDLPF
jgi:hypothetical protein